MYILDAEEIKCVSGALTWQGHQIVVPSAGISPSAKRSIEDFAQKHFLNLHGTMSPAQLQRHALSKVSELVNAGVYREDMLAYLENWKHAHLV